MPERPGNRKEKKDTHKFLNLKKWLSFFCLLLLFVLAVHCSCTTVAYSRICTGLPLATDHHRPLFQAQIHAGERWVTDQ